MGAADFDQSILPLFEQTRSEWLASARLHAKTLALGGKEITIDDVRAVCPPPTGLDPRVNGAVFHPRKEWECVGYRKSDRSACHGRPVAIWKLA